MWSGARLSKTAGTNRGGGVKRPKVFASGFEVLGFGARGLRFRVEGLGFRVQDLGFRV